MYNNTTCITGVGPQIVANAKCRTNAKCRISLPKCRTVLTQDVALKFVFYSNMSHHVFALVLCLSFFFGERAESLKQEGVLE